MGCAGGRAHRSWEDIAVKVRARRAIPFPTPKWSFDDATLRDRRLPLSKMRDAGWMMPRHDIFRIACRSDASLHCFTSLESRTMNRLPQLLRPT